MTNPHKLVEILMVEDNPGDVLITKKSLKEAKFLNGFNAVKDGEEAMDYLYKRGQFVNAKRPDLILLDLNLPKKDGREVLEEIKNDPNLKSIPVVVLSGSQAEEDIIRSYELQVNCYISKPVDLEKFAEVIKKIDEFWFEIVILPPNGDRTG